MVSKKDLIVIVVFVGFVSFLLGAITALLIVVYNNKETLTEQPKTAIIEKAKGEDKRSDIVEYGEVNKDILEPVFSAQKSIIDGSVIVVKTYDGHDIPIYLKSAHLRGPESWSFKIKVDSQKAQEGTWVGATEFSADDSSPSVYTNIVIYVRTVQQKQKWEECIMQIVKQNYAPRDVVPCQ